tara:strand:- start:1324 stop:1830 length:507 start_codon:yes stop_codon:yes gene_type:complete
MPRGLKETSSIIAISASVEESAANTFTAQQVDLQLNPLDNEVFVVYGIDLDTQEPELIPATATSVRTSLSTTRRTSVGGLADANVIAAGRIVTQDAAGGPVTNQFSSDSAPATQLDYLAIISTNDFFLNIEGANNVNTKLMQARLYGVRAKADSSVYAALVQSELLSA